MTQSQACPVILEAQDILVCQEELSRKLRHLRMSMKRCPVCPHSGKCEGLKVIHNAIDQAIREVSEEWGL